MDENIHSSKYYEECSPKSERDWLREIAVQLARVVEVLENGVEIKQ